MANSVKKELLNLMPSANLIESKHPIYDTFGNSISKEEARKSISINDERIILNFGLIRDYKGLDILIKASKYLKGKLENFKIVVVGECYNGQRQYLELAKKMDVTDCIDFKFEFVSNKDVSKYFCAADVVVLPYRSATQSGIIPIAYHFNKPVITTNVGGLAECVKQAKTGFVCNPDPQGVSKGLLDFFKSNENFSKNVSEYKKQFTWEAYINNIISVIK